MQDDLTRYLIVTPMANQEATTVAEKFVENVVCFTGAPNELVTDQGTNFMSQVMKDVCSLLKIKKINTSAYHPQGNIVERANEMKNEAQHGLDLFLFTEKRCRYSKLR